MTIRTATSPFARAARPYVTITSLVATLAAGVGGCGTSTERAKRAAGVESQTTASIEVDATRGRFDPSYFAGQAEQYGAPLEWAERAGSVVTAIEVQRATAEATRVRAAADHATALAEANTLLAEAVSAFEVQSAEARRVRESAEAGYAAEETRVAADEQAYEAEVEAKMQAARAKLDDAVSRAELLRAQADDAYAEAEAAHDRLIAEAEAHEDNTRVTIEQLRASAGSIIARAEAEAGALGVEADSRRTVGYAQANAYECEIAATGEWAQTRQAELVREAAAVREETASQVEAISAQADAIENFELDERYTTAIAAANALHEEMLEHAKVLRQSTTTDLIAAAATFTSDRRDVQSRLDADGLTYEAELARIASDIRVAEARAAMARARAQEVEHDARAKFVTEIAAAMGGDTQEEMAHAFAWAQGLADDVGSGNGSYDAASLTVDTPEVIDAIEALVAQMAEAEHLRRAAVDVLDRSKSSTIMRRSEIEVWRTESRAAAQAALEGIAQAEKERVAQLQQRLADADETESQTNIAFEQATLAAEADRTDARARLENLLRREQLTADAGESRAETILTKAAAVREEGSEDVTRLTRLRDAARTEVDAIAEALDAQARQVLADAGVEADEFFAMAETAEQTISAEMESRSADATRIITEGGIDRTEAYRVADGVVSMAEAAMTQTIAAIESDARKEESHLQTRLAEARAVRDAAVAAADETLARATASYASFQAEDTTRRSEAASVERTLLAFVEEQHAVSDAQDAAVFADFSARLATLQAGRDREYADAYFKEFLVQAGLSETELRQYVEAADVALSRLREASRSQGTARTEITGPMPEAVTDGSVEVLRVESMSANGVASVPTEDDE